VTRSRQFCIPLEMFCAFLIAMVVLGAVRLSAQVREISITKRESPTFGGASFGSVGQYQLIQGTIQGEVDPSNPQNAVIVDLQNAPRNADGMVSYSVDFQIILPMDLSKGNHRIVFDLPQRGKANALSTLNNGSGQSKTASGTPGNGFLMNQGYTVVEAAWDITVSQSSAGFGVTFPVARNPDGSSITGIALEEFVVDKNATPATEPLTYPAASADKSQAALTVRENYGDTPMVIPPSGWDYTDTTLTAVKLTSGAFGGPGSFGPTALYEFTYIAKDPLVAGLGFAALRDFATFLRTAQVDDNGVPNPLAGDVQAIYTVCVSQPCRAMHDFVLLGFNEQEFVPNENGEGGAGDQHQKVFDGVINWIAGGDGIFMNYRFAQPARTSRQHIARWYPEFQFPWANHITHDQVTSQTAARLDACQRTDTCPKIFELNSENEYWSKGGSLLTTDTQGNDLQLNDTPNVRYYLLSSLPHIAGIVPGICQQPQNPLAPAPVLRALLVDMDEWMTNGTPPPDNRVPTRTDGTLAPSLPQSGMGFPHIPGVTYNGILHTGDLFNFGPQFQAGILNVLPPPLVGTPYPVFVPETDADGNDIAGIRLPDVSVPLATYTGWALRASAPGDPVPIVDGCDALGQRIPFPKTQADGLATGDRRLSIQERYPDHATYVNLVTQAAQQLAAQRLLLDLDVQAYISAAVAATVP
jgi:alpha/beta hydrolase family protein